MTSLLVLALSGLLAAQEPSPYPVAPGPAPRDGDRPAVTVRALTPPCAQELHQAALTGSPPNGVTSGVRLERAFDLRIDGCPAPVVVHYIDPARTGVDNNLARRGSRPPQPRGWADE